VSDWVCWGRSRQTGRVIERETVFGESYARVWIPESGTVVRVRAGDLEAALFPDLEEIRYRAYAGRIIQSLGGDVLLAPLDSRVIPLPHQIQVLDRIVRGRQMRLLLADEVGLGKTIEAGLVIRELKLRRRIQRILVVAPKGLLHQWATELQQHFGETFGVVTGEDLRAAGSRDTWAQRDQLIVSQDGIKPIARRRGWEAERIAQYNQQRYEAVLSAGWDLIVVDEAHRLGGSTDAVARFRLGQGLAAAAPYLLLLTATPHQGKTDQFRRILSLLDGERFIETQELSAAIVKPYVVRTGKRSAINADGMPLFQPRRVEMIAVKWDDPHYAIQRELYEAVTLYVRQGYRQAMAEKAFTETFLLILMQRLVTSSPAAIERAIRRRLTTLAADESPPMDGTMSEDDDAEEVLNGESDVQAPGGLEELLVLASRALHSPDARMDRLMALVDDLRREESSDTKFLIFTEFLPTQAMLFRVLAGYGYGVSVLNGQMDMEERWKVQEAFRQESQFLISTDAGGEGLNLQFAHVVVNYDLPWNPMRIEQRIGRVDRIGQDHPVRAFNFAIEGTVEYRVHEVLLDKLRRILEELGIDKLGDVLDSSGLDVDYQDLYLGSLMDPENTDQRLAQWVESVRETADRSMSVNQSIEAGPPDLGRLKEVLHHPLPGWMAAMTQHYANARGGHVEHTMLGWTITFPDGTVVPHVVFQPDSDAAGQTYLALDHPRIQKMLNDVPYAPVEGRLGRLTSEVFPFGTKGLWSLWELSLRYGEEQELRILPLFVSEEGRVFRTSARQIWEHLTHPSFQGTVSPSIRELDAREYRHLFRFAEQEAGSVYRDLRAEHARRLADESEAMEKAYVVRKELTERVGLANVRESRLRRLTAEYDERRQKLAEGSEMSPELRPILIVEVDRP